MVPHVIHLSKRTDRLALLISEFQNQKITEYQIWEGIVDPTLPARGISQAHKQIVAYAQKLKMPEILICEDDIHFTAKGAFQFFISNKPRDYDIYLGGISEGDLKKDGTVKDFSGLTIYLINQKFYDLFLSMPENLNLDRALCNKGKFIVSNPLIAVQYNGFSDHLKQFCDYTDHLIGKKLYGVDP
jgi:hypothetical protein